MFILLSRETGFFVPFLKFLYEMSFHSPPCDQCDQFRACASGCVTLLRCVFHLLLLLDNCTPLMLTLTDRPHSSVKKILEVGVSEAWGFFASKGTNNQSHESPAPDIRSKNARSKLDINSPNRRKPTTVSATSLHAWLLRFVSR